jgi:hypothetical protein
MTDEEILLDYEDLELADIQAVLLYAARLSQVKRISVRDSAISRIMKRDANNK